MHNISNDLILILSAIAPVLIFSKLALERYLTWDYNFEMSTEKQHVYQKQIDLHFQLALKDRFVLKRDNEILTGYVRPAPSGEYLFYQSRGPMLMRLRKDHSGWALLDIAKGAEDKKKFLMPLILQLEYRLFN